MKWTVWLWICFGCNGEPAMPDGGTCMPSTLRPSARKDIDSAWVKSDGALFVYGGDQAPFDPNQMVLPKQFVDEMWSADNLRLVVAPIRFARCVK